MSSNPRSWIQILTLTVPGCVFLTKLMISLCLSFLIYKVVKIIIHLSQGVLRIKYSDIYITHSILKRLTVRRPQIPLPVPPLLLDLILGWWLLLGGASYACNTHATQALGGNHGRQALLSPYLMILLNYTSKDVETSRPLMPAQNFSSQKAKNVQKDFKFSLF